MNSNFRNMALWGLIALLLIALFQMFQSPTGQTKTDEIAYSNFLDAVGNDRVKSVTITGDRISGAYTDSSTRFVTYAPFDPELVKRLQDQKVEINVTPSSEGRSTFMSVLINWLPMLLLIGVWIFIMRQMQSGQGKAMGFGKSKAKLLTEMSGKVTFDDTQLPFPPGQDDSALKKALGDIHYTPLAEGIADTIARFKWAIENGRM